MAQIKNQAVHQRWFQDLLKKRNLTQRAVAKALKLHPSAISRIFQGQQLLRPHEVARLADVLMVPPEDVLFHAGAANEFRAKGARAKTPHPTLMTIDGWVDGDLRVHANPPKNAAKVPCPLPSSDGVVALVARTAGSRFEGIEGALIFYRPAAEVEADARGRPSVVRVMGQRYDRSCIPRKGFEPGMFTLSALFTSDVLAEDVELESASPILWMKL
jgi:transcriptional regulator with XRE-family HTH domain